MFTVIKPHTNFDFMGKRYIWMGISLVLIVVSVALFFIKGLNYGVDFSGGTEVDVVFKDSKIDAQEVRALMESANVKDVQVQKFNDPDRNEYVIRAQGVGENTVATSKQIEVALTSKYKTGEYEIRKVDVVGPKVGKELKLSGIYSLIYAMLGIFIYIMIRFDYKFSAGAIVALIHDPLIVIGVFAITQYQFTLSSVAALLKIGRAHV